MPIIPYIPSTSIYPQYSGFIHFVTSRLSSIFSHHDHRILHSSKLLKVGPELFYTKEIYRPKISPYCCFAYLQLFPGEVLQQIIFWCDIESSPRWSHSPGHEEQPSCSQPTMRIVSLGLINGILTSLPSITWGFKRT